MRLIFWIYSSTIDGAEINYSALNNAILMFERTSTVAMVDGHGTLVDCLSGLSRESAWTK